MAEATSSTSTKSSSGMDPKTAGLLAWLFAPLSSLILVLIEKDDKFVRFHAWQSLAFGALMVALSLVSMVLSFVGIGLCTGAIGTILWIVVNIVGAIKAYQGEMYKFPVIGDWAENQVK